MRPVLNRPVDNVARSRDGSSRRVSFSEETPSKTPLEVLEDQKQLGINPSSSVITEINYQQDELKQAKIDALKRVLFNHGKPVQESSTRRADKSLKNGGSPLSSMVDIEHPTDWFDKRRVLGSGLLMQKLHHELLPSDIKNPIREGSLDILQKNLVNSAWERRYCIVKDRWFFVMKEKDSLEAHQIIPLSHCVLDCYKMKHKAFTLHRLGHHKSFVFQAESPELKAAWMDDILKGIFNAWQFDKLLPDKKKEPTATKVRKSLQITDVPPRSPGGTSRNALAQQAANSSKRRHSVSIVTGDIHDVTIHSSIGVGLSNASASRRNSAAIQEEELSVFADPKSPYYNGYTSTSIPSTVISRNQDSDEGRVKGSYKGQNIPASRAILTVPSDSDEFAAPHLRSRSNSNDFRATRPGVRNSSSFNSMAGLLGQQSKITAETISESLRNNKDPLNAQLLHAVLDSLDQTKSGSSSRESTSDGHKMSQSELNAVAALFG